MAIDFAKSRLVASLALSLLATGSVPVFAAPKAAAAKPAAPPAASSPAAKSSDASAQKILAYKPSQRDVQIDRPEGDEIAKRTVTTNKSGYILRDGDGGDILANFFDSNGDNAVDQWSYYKDGVEVFLRYRLQQKQHPRPVPLAEHGRHAMGGRHERRRQD